MKALRVFEKFTEDSDPIQDLGIGLIHEIKEWLKKVALEEDFKNPNTILLYAAKYKKVQYAAYALSIGANIHYIKDIALRYAAINLDWKMIKYLLSKGADITADENFILEQACIHNNVKLAKLCFDAGATLSQKLKTTIITYSAEKVEKLYAKYNSNIKENVNEKFTEDSDPVRDMGIGMMHQIEKFVKLKEPGATKTEYLWTCAKYGKAIYVQYLIEKGENIHYSGEKPLRVACIRGHAKVVKLLLDAGANVHVDKGSPLRYATQFVHTKVIKIIQDHIAKENKLKKGINEKFTEDSDPITDMGIGMLNQIKEFCEKQKNYDSNLSITIYLNICAEHKKYEFVNFLLDLPNIDVTYRQGLAFRWISHTNNIKLMQKFLDKGIDINIRCGEESALYNAINENNLTVVKFLIKNNAIVTDDDMGICIKGSKIYNYLKNYYKP